MANLSNINNKFLVTTGGNVGINVTGPTKKIDVYQDTVGLGAADFRHVNGNRILINPSYNYYDAYNHIFRGLNGTDTHMTIDLNGNVGIGTTNIGTQSNLYLGAINSSEGGQLTLQKATGGTLAAHIDAYTAGGNDYMRILSGGDTSTTAAPFVFDLTNIRVGIGTTSPGTFLQLGTYNVAGKYINQATYPDIPSEHMMHITAPSTNAYYGGGISFGETAFTAANIVVRDAGGSGALDLCFGTGTVSGVTEKMRIANNGNVGIGSTSPQEILHIEKDDASPVLLVKAAAQTSSTAPYAKLVLAAGSASGFDTGSNIMGYRTADFSSAAARSSGLKFGVLQNNTAKNAMWITEAQNVGIGTDSPDLTGFGWNVLTVMGGTVAGSAGVLELAAPSTDANDQNLGIISFNNGSTRNAQIAVNRESATNDGKLSFWTSAGSGGIEERMRIKSNGQVNISQKPNSGLEYDLLINLGTSPDGLVGYQTREQFNNATLQKWYNVDAANSGSSQWVRLGTMSNFAQGGYTFCLTFFGHTGYNASNNQDFNCKLFMKTSNGGGTGPRFNSWVENTGKNVASPAFKWINTNASGTPTVGGTSYELYMNVPAYCNGSIYAINKHSGDWTSENAIGQTDPGSNSTTVLQAANVFNILNTNVGIGTISPSQKLEVTGNTYVTGYVQASSALIGYKNGFATFGSNSTVTGIALSRDFLPSSYPDLIINSSGGVGMGVSAESNSRLHVKYISGGNNCKMTLESNNSGDSYINYSAASNEMSAGFDTSAAQFIIAGGDNLSVPKFALTQSTGNTTIAGTLTQNSDITLKENIKPLESQLEIVSKLNPVSYNKIGFEDNEVGFIAQEVEKLLPELVREDKDGLKSLAYGNMNAILVKAIQELKAEIELLKSK